MTKSKNSKPSRARECAENVKLSTATVSATVSLAEFVENPDNPSVASDEDITRLAGKLKRVPLGLTAMRIAYVTDAIEGKRMVISGNKRLRVLKQAYGENGEVPAEWFADVTAMSEAERHEFIVTANVSDGEWDVDKLLAQYGREELPDMMKPEEVEKLLADVVDDSDEFGTDFSLPNEGKSEFGTMTFVVNDKQRDFINDCISVAVNCEGFNIEGDNKNENGAALYLISRQWLERIEKECDSYGLERIEKEYKELREYLRNALASANLKSSDVDKFLGTQMSGHYFGDSQWAFPTRDVYEKLKTIMPLDREYMECKLKEMAYNKVMKIKEIHGKV